MPWSCQLVSSPWAGCSGVGLILATRIHTQSSRIWQIHLVRGGLVQQVQCSTSFGVVSLAGWQQRRSCRLGCLDIAVWRFAV